MSSAERLQTVRSVERAFSVLEQLAARGRECGLTELSDAVGLSVATTHRVVRTLIDGGYMRQLPSRGYALGLKLVELGDKARVATGFGAQPSLRDLADELGHTAVLAILDGTDVLFVAQAAPRGQALRLVLDLGHRTPAESSAIGEAILASLPPNGVRYPPRLAARIDAVRRQGYASDHGRAAEGIHCVAVGLHQGVIPAAVAVLGSAALVSGEQRSVTLASLKATAARLSAELSR